MAKRSAGLLMFRRSGSRLEVFLVHPGGPFWEKKDLGVWSVPKGEYVEGEDPFLAAKREFEEETGIKPEGEYFSIGEIRQPSGKTITAWAFKGDLDPVLIKSNLFSMEWPPNSANIREFPEVDRGDWFSVETARKKITKGQAGFLDVLVEKLRRQTL
jgi:predicted NUDIX family NTP pyrophosphohydrolase